MRELLVVGDARPARRAQVDRDEVIAVGAVGDDVGGGAVARDAHRARARRGSGLPKGSARSLSTRRKLSCPACATTAKRRSGNIFSARPLRLRDHDGHVTDGHAGGHARDDAAALGARDDRRGAAADAHRRQAAEVVALDDDELAGDGDAVGLALPSAGLRAGTRRRASRMRLTDGRSEGGRHLAHVDHVGKPGSWRSRPRHLRDQPKPRLSIFAYLVQHTLQYVNRH